MCQKKPPRGWWANFCNFGPQTRILAHLFQKRHGPKYMQNEDVVNIGPKPTGGIFKFNLRPVHTLLQINRTRLFWFHNLNQYSSTFASQLSPSLIYPLYPMMDQASRCAHATHQPPATRCQPATRQPPATRCNPPAASHQKPATSHQPPATSNQPPYVNPPATSRQPPATRCTRVVSVNPQTGGLPVTTIPSTSSGLSRQAQTRTLCGQCHWRCATRNLLHRCRAGCVLVRVWV